MLRRQSQPNHGLAGAKTEGSRYPIIFADAHDRNWPTFTLDGRAEHGGSARVLHTAALRGYFTRRLCAGTSDVDLLRDLNGVMDLDTEVADGTIDLGISEQQLDRLQVAASPINRRA